MYCEPDENGVCKICGVKVLFPVQLCVRRESPEPQSVIGRVSGGRPKERGAALVEDLHTRQSWSTMVNTKYLVGCCDKCVVSVASGEGRICPETRQQFTSCCGGNPSTTALINRYSAINAGLFRCPLGLNVKTVENEKNTNT